MSDGEQPEVTLSKSEEQLPTTGVELAGKGIAAVRDVVLHVVKGVLDWRVITPISCTGLIVAAIAGTDMAGLMGLMDLLVSFVTGSVFAVGGWLTAFVVAVLGGGVIITQQRQIKRQGKVNSELKDQLDSGRVSSDGPERLEKYAQTPLPVLLAEHGIVPAPKNKKIEGDNK